MSIQSVPNMIQGVSQQAPQQRRDSQCEAQFDCINSPLDGCVARPGGVVRAAYAGLNWSGAYFTEVSHAEENYLVGITSEEEPEVFAIDLADGTVCTVTGADTDGYLAAGTKISRERFRSQTVEDSVFVINRQVKPAMDSGIVTPSWRKEAIVFIREGAFGSDFTLSLDGPGGASSHTLTTHPTSTNLATAGYVAGGLKTALHGVSGYTVEQSGSSLLIYRADGQDFTVETKDDNGDNLMFAFKGVVSNYVNLPARGFDGVSLKVGGESRTTNDDFYVRFDGTSSTGRWVETVGEGEETTLDPDTMPHVLTLTGYRTFSWAPKVWSTRIAGDSDTVRDPGFVGHYLRDIFWHERRLGIVHDAGAVWSKTKFPYTFFADTAQTLLATAPVDTSLIAATSSSRGSSELDVAVQVDDSLFIWAQRAQFRIAYEGNGFRPDTISSKVSTSYEYVTGIDPQVVGETLYFASSLGIYAVVRAVDFQQGKPVGNIDVTSHVPKLVPAKVTSVATSDSLRCIFLASEDSGNVHLYNFLVSNREFAQSAWNTWRIAGGNILWMTIRGNELLLLQQRAEGVVYLAFDLNPSAVDAGVVGAEYATRLDLRVHSDDLTVTYDSGTDTSSFTLPYVPIGAEVLVVTLEDNPDGYSRGRSFTVSDVTGAVVEVAGDIRDYVFAVGQRISAERLESQFFVRSDKGVMPTDRLAVNDFHLEFAQTGYTRLEVSSPTRVTSVTTFEGRQLGTPTSTTETPRVGTGAIKAEVGELSGAYQLRIINDSFLPSRWQTCSYDYTAVGRAGA